MDWDSEKSKRLVVGNRFSDCLTREIRVLLK